MIQPVKEKIILGIDPGTTIMGYGVLRVKGTKPEMIAMGIIDLRKFANHYLKLRHIHERVLSIIECCSVCCIFPKKRCLPLWMRRTVWRQPIVIFCKWDVRQWKKDIAVGKILLRKIPIK